MSSSSERESMIVIIFFILLLILLFAGGCGGSYYVYQKSKGSCACENSSDHKKESFIGRSSEDDIESNYNALYTDTYQYTQPQGDVNAQQYARSGQGTEGSFLPLQGVGAGIHMKNSTNENQVIPSPFKGVIGGQPNLTEKEYSTRWIGFNNFGYPFEEKPEEISNSYSISAANQRVCNSGQKCPNLPCQDWWPSVSRTNEFCTQGSDAMVECNTVPQNINTCKGKGGTRFEISQNTPQWKKVMQS